MLGAQCIKAIYVIVLKYSLSAAAELPMQRESIQCTYCRSGCNLVYSFCTVHTASRFCANSACTLYMKCMFALKMHFVYKMCRLTNKCTTALTRRSYEPNLAHGCTHWSHWHDFCAVNFSRFHSQLVGDSQRLAGSSRGHGRTTRSRPRNDGVASRFETSWGIASSWRKSR